MEGFMEFLVNNYLWFLVISLLLIFALIGYLVDTKNNKELKKEIKIEKSKKGKKTASTINQEKTLEQNDIETPEENDNNNDVLTNDMLNEDIKDVNQSVNQASISNSQESLKEEKSNMDLPESKQVNTENNTAQEFIIEDAPSEISDEKEEK